MIKEYVLITVIIRFITHAMLSMMYTINTYKKNESWYYIPCPREISPICHIENKKSNIFKSLNKPSPSLVKLINQLNNFTDKTKVADENLPNSKYRDLGYF